RYGGVEQKGPQREPPAYHNPGKQSGRVDTEPSRVHIPKTLGDRAAALGAEIGPGLGRAPSHRGDQPQVAHGGDCRGGRLVGERRRQARGESGGYGRAGLVVGDASVSSRDCAWQTLEYFSAAACGAVTGHDEPSRAYGESKDGKDS